MSIVATKHIGKMLVYLESNEGKGCLSVSNDTDPENIVGSTGFHYTYDDALDTFFKIESPKDVHNIFDRE